MNRAFVRALLIVLALGAIVAAVIAKGHRLIGVAVLLLLMPAIVMAGRRAWKRRAWAEAWAFSLLAAVAVALVLLAALIVAAALSIGTPG
jgi:hypothetical protein